MKYLISYVWRHHSWRDPAWKPETSITNLNPVDWLVAMRAGLDNEEYYQITSVSPINPDEIVTPFEIYTNHACIGYHDDHLRDKLQKYIKGKETVL